MADDRSDVIRARAYEIWEAEGSPHGRHDEHWTQAAREIGEAQAEAAADRPADASLSAPGEVPASPLDDTTPPADTVPPATPAKRGRKSAGTAAVPKGRRAKNA